MNMYGDRPQEQRTSQGVWPWRLTVFSFTILVVALAAYVGLHFGYTVYLKSEIAAADNDLKNIAASVPAEDQERFLAFYKQLAVLKDILDIHTAETRALAWLERNTHEKVFFMSALFDGSTASLQLSGRADSYDVIAEQLLTLDHSPEVVRYRTGELRRSEDRVLFDLFVTLKPEAFRY